ncbi:MAG: efflux RND transporter periplasmic adaptor subunit [Prolixibacteraceae bacterium]|nr:efflux RND transporter periplasmic adaptor subunit [Prolixibacteraceae bacterium]
MFKLIIPLLLCVVLFFQSCSEKAEQGMRVERGDFVQTITETGELEAVNAKTFVMPRFGRYWYEMKIIGLLEHGSVVEAGDSLIQFDPSEIKKFIIDRETELETQKANLEKTYVEIENRKSDIRSTLQSEQAAFDLKKLEVEQYKFESEKVRDVKELEFEQAKIRLDKAKTRAMYQEIIAENQLQIQQIRVKRIDNQVKDAYEIIPDLTIRTPIPGIFQIATKRRSHEMLQLGDEVRMGRQLGSVPDLTWMKVNTMVDETDFLKVYPGQPVKVRLDAMPDVVFDGKITYMSKLCRLKDREGSQKVFDLEVKLNVSDERLKPGMTVSCEFICADLEDVVQAPLECVDFNEGRSFVYLKRSGKTIKQEVQTGAANNTHVVIEGNVEPGQRLIPLNQLNQEPEE